MYIDDFQVRIQVTTIATAIVDAKLEKPRFLQPISTSLRGPRSSDISDFLRSSVFFLGSILIISVWMAKLATRQLLHIHYAFRFVSYVIVSYVRRRRQRRLTTTTATAAAVTAVVVPQCAFVDVTCPPIVNSLLPVPVYSRCVCLSTHSLPTWRKDVVE